MPKPSKKAKANKPAVEITTAEPTEDPEAAILLEDNLEAQIDDPIPMDRDDVAAPGGDDMENTGEPASPVRVSPPRASPAPVSPVPTAVPLQPTAASSADVEITGLSFTAPTEPVTLARHTAKEEKFQQDKGKWSTDLSSYAQLSAQELHSGYLNRLFTSRDYQVGLVNMMKDKYEVTFFPFTFVSAL